MKLLLHIGPFKTGTSSVQAALHANRDSLAARGIYVPDLSGAFGAHGIRAWPALFLGDKPLSDPMLALPWETPQAVRRQSADFLDRLEAEATGDVLCLSSEFLSIAPDVEALRDRLHRITPDITVLAYVRGPRSLFTSQIQQQIRGGKTLSELPLPQGRGGFQRRAITRFMEAFGRDALEVRHFHRDNLAGGDVVEDLRQVLDRMAPQGAPELPLASTQNESLTGAAVAWLLTVNEGLAAHIPPKQRIAMVRRLMQDPDVRALPKLRLTDPGLLAAIDSDGQGDCDWLNATFLSGQLPLESGTFGPVLAPDDLRARLRSWLMGHITPQAMEIIVQALAGMRDLAGRRRAR